MIPIIKLQSVVLDCQKPAELAKFYCNFLGGKVELDIESFVVLSLPGGSVNISCQYEENYVPPTWPGSKEEQMQMEHLDFSVEDMETAVEYALSLGAVKAAAQYWKSGYGPQWITLIDPAGHPFCLCQHEEQ